MLCVPDAFLLQSSVAHYYITSHSMVYTSFNSLTLLASMQLSHIWTSLHPTLAFMMVMEVGISSLCFQLYLSNVSIPIFLSKEEMISY